MSIIQHIRLRLLVWFLRANINIVSFFRRIIGRAPHYTKFSPNRSFRIPSTVSRRGIKINVFEPNAFDARKKYPVYMNFHASGFMFNMLGTDADFCRFVSDQTGAVVLDCDYAKAPEYPFPCAWDDARDIISHVVENHEGYFDTSKLAIGGFSAGGNLALTSSTDQPTGTLKAAITFYPPANLYPGTKRPQPEGSTIPEHPPFFVKFFDDCLCPPSVNVYDPRLSLTKIPVELFPEHVFIVSCGHDLLQYEETELADQLKRGGVKVVRRHIPGVGHAWDKEAQGGSVGAEEKHNAYKAAVDILKLAFRAE